MLEIHWSLLTGLMGISAIVGFFCTAAYIDWQAKKAKQAITITDEEQANIEALSKAMDETLKRQAEPEKSDTQLFNEQIRDNIKRIRPDLVNRPMEIERRIIPIFRHEGRC